MNLTTAISYAFAAVQLKRFVNAANFIISKTDKNVANARHLLWVMMQTNQRVALHDK